MAKRGRQSIITSVFLYARSRIFRLKTCFAVSWALTYRCNLRCKYCAYWKKTAKELSTKEIFKILHEMANAGVRGISFTGGEPLLREDIADIINYTKSKGIFVSLSTNATKICEKIEDIKNADSIQVSLDGDKKVQDAIRGEGTYQAVIRALSLLKKEGKKVRIATVLSQYNLDNLDFIFGISERFNMPVIFQPATKQLLGSKEINLSAPKKQKYVEAIEKIIQKKKRNSCVFNSFVGLEHLKHYPNNKKLFCTGGWDACDIEPDGTMLACDRYPFPQKRINILEEGFAKAFRKLDHVSCQQCWCASLNEFNYIMSFDLRALFNLLRSGHFKLKAESFK